MTEQQLLLNACKVIEEFIKEEFIKQGHSLSQAWENSVITQDDGADGVCIYATGYGMIVNAGVTADRIPFGGTGTGGGTSQYITGLVRFWKLRRPGLTDREALRLAFATANVQKEEGMSTIASAAYSSTGQRQQFMQAIETLVASEVDRYVFTGLDELIAEQADEPKIMYL